MQRHPSPIPFVNTFRDSNDNSQTPQEFVIPSAPNIEPMDFNSESRQSIIRPVEPDKLSSTRITNKPSLRSIIRSNDSGDDEAKSSQEPPEQLFNGRLINDNNSLRGAAGYDSTRFEEIDADAAYALQLQQEEYSKESLIPNRHHYLPFAVEPDDELVATTQHFPFDSNNPHLTNDEQLAAQLQARENRNRQRYRRPPMQFFPIQQRSNPASTQTSENDESEIEPIHAFRFAQRPPMNNEDESDEDGPHMNIPHPFLRFLANQGRQLPEGFPPFFPGYRRDYRRSGNLQDTEEDFGPEDYERLLQLDDTIHKKKLNRDQINTIPQEHFHHRSNNNDEENKCGVCLEFFEENQTLRRFPCLHVYHKECADRWLQENNVCPICREPPVKGQPTSNSRHHRDPNHTRRPPNNNRNPTNRNPTNRNNNNNNTQFPNSRRGPAPNRQS